MMVRMELLKMSDGSVSLRISDEMAGMEVCISRRMLINDGLSGVASFLGNELYHLGQAGWAKTCNGVSPDRKDGPEPG